MQSNARFAPARCETCLRRPTRLPSPASDSFPVLPHPFPCPTPCLPTFTKTATARTRTWAWYWGRYYPYSTRTRCVTNRSGNAYPYQNHYHSLLVPSLLALEPLLLVLYGNRHSPSWNRYYSHYNHRYQYSNAKNPKPHAPHRPAPAPRTDSPTLTADVTKRYSYLSLSFPTTVPYPCCYPVPFFSCDATVPLSLSLRNPEALSETSLDHKCSLRC